MSWIAEFSLPAAEFPLGRAFERWPWLTFELDRVVPSRDTVMPYFWVHLNDDQPDLAEIEALFSDIPELRFGVLMDNLGDKGLFRAEWKPEHMGVMSAIASANLTVISATGSTDGWTFELRAEHGDQFSEFQQSCEADRINVTLTRLGRLSEDGPEYGLTSDQREALIIAYEGGYYEENRRANMETLAGELGISRQAFSSRLRRGYRNLIENTVVATDPPKNGMYNQG